MDGQVSYSLFEIIFRKNFFKAWLTAAVDAGERIIGAVPIVMDILNFRTVRSIKSDHFLPTLNNL